MKNENKNVTFTNNVFFCIVTDWAVSGIYKKLKAYLRYHVQ